MVGNQNIESLHPREWSWFLRFKRDHRFTDNSIQPYMLYHGGLETIPAVNQFPFSCEKAGSDCCKSPWKAPEEDKEGDEKCVQT